LQTGVAARHPEHVTKGGNDNTWLACQGNSFVKVSISGNTYRATRTGEHLYSFGQKLAYAMLEYSHGMPTTELH